MPKFRVKVRYDLTVHETYEVEINRSDYDSEEVYQEELEGFEECPYDWCDATSRTSKEDGDIRDGSWDEDVEEINPLDQIVSALKKDEATPVPEFIKEIDASPYLELG